jgi:hypothetical protein
MQPLPTFTSKSCKSHFSISSIKHQTYAIYSADKLKVDFKPLDGKVDIGCIVATCFL